MKNSIPWMCLVAGAALSLTSCAVPGVKVLTQPLTDNALVGSLLNSNTLTEDSRLYLQEQGLMGTYRRSHEEAIGVLQERLDSDPSHALRMSLIELCNDTGSKLSLQDPERAMGFHMGAADLAFEVGRKKATKSGEEWDALLAAYNYSAGKVATLLFETGNDWTEVVEVEGPWKTYRIQSRTSGHGYFDPGYFDTLDLADNMEFKKIAIERIRKEGIGASLVGYRKATEERREENPLMPPIGISLPVNVTLDFTKGENQVELAFHDLMVTETMDFNGKQIDLAADLTAPLALLFNYQEERNYSWKSLTHPEKFEDGAGLFQLEPFRKDQIPVIFVHGLVSSPKIWLTAVNTLRRDPELRSRYQVLLFKYPTGFPIAYNAASLRRELAKFQEQVDPSGTNPNMSNLVMVGHSMGAVLSSSQIRSSGDTMTSKMFTRPIDDLGGVTEVQKEALKELLVYEADPHIKRVVFVAGPHRGSESAAGFAEKLGKSLIKFPVDLVFGGWGTMPQIEGLTEQGKEIVNSRPDSIQSLQPNAPGLLAVLEQPIREGVIYHSIIGRTDKEDALPLEETTDGTVPYWSSRLEGAASEVVYHAAHTPLTKLPETIEEVRRILYLHAGLSYPGPASD